MKLFLSTISFSITVLFMTCSTTKPVITDIPDIDKQSPIYYSIDDLKLSLNGGLLYDLTSFGKTSGKDSIGSQIEKSDIENVNILKHPFGKFDYSFALEPSLSHSSKLLAKANDDFSLISISFSRDVDIDIVDLKDLQTIKTYEISLPNQEYKDEKYQIPWSRSDEAFFAMIEDTLFKIFPTQNILQKIIVRNQIYDFSISPKENYALLFTQDSLLLLDLKTKILKPVYEASRTLGINRKFVRAYSWQEDESKVIFAEGWKLFVYDIIHNTLTKTDARGKVFSAEWINSDDVLVVTGDYPDDMSVMQSNRYFKILKYSLSTEEFVKIHERMNHEPFNIKPRLSPSKKLILFSEKKSGRTYLVKLMTLDGLNENVLAEGYLPFWGKVNK